MMRQYPQLMYNAKEYINQYGEKPDGSNTIIMNPEDQRRYPKLTALIKRLPALVEQTPKVQEALIKWSGFSVGKIKELLKFGVGPTLVIYDVQSQYGKGTTGHCSCPGFPVSRLEIDQSTVEEYERSNSSSTEQVLASFIATITLHEFVHYGTGINGINEKSAQMEFGNQFEKQVFRTTVTRTNASQYIYKFFKQ